MTRAEEFDLLMQELETTPERLNNTVARAKARTRRQRVRKWVGAPLISLSAACFAFVLLVNFSTPFAMACAKVPFFKELAEAVSFSSSLYAAVENEWVQPIGQTDTDNGYTMTVEYLIVDQKQLNVFYTLKGGEELDPKEFYMVNSDFLDEQGEELPFSTFTTGSHVNGEIYQITADFVSVDRVVPGWIRMECELTKDVDGADDHQKETVAEFSFDLSFDPQFTAQAEVVEVNRWLELDGQKVMLKNVEIYPTHVRINLEDHPDNTAWLKDLELYLQDERGVRYEGVSNGITGSGSADSPFMQSFRVESNFFSDCKKLTLCINGAKWLEKDRQWTWVDLSSGETGWMPEGISLKEYSKTDDDARVTFRVYIGEGAPMRNPFYRWRDPGQEEQYIGGHSVSTAWDVEDGPAEGYCDVSMRFEDLSGDRLELMLDFSLAKEYTKPVKIPIK